MRLATLTLVLAFQLLASASSAEDFHPQFFAFQNGVHFPSTAKRIEVLKELGYDGMGSINLRDLANRCREFKDADLKIYSIYTGIQLGKDGAVIPDGLPQAIRGLQGSDVVIELFIGGTGTDEQAVAGICSVADLAAKSNLRVVLYPHSGCYVDHLADAVRLAKLTKRNNVGIMFNLCHYLMVEPDTNLAKALKEAQPYLWRVSLCGAEPGTKSWKTLIQPLDQGSFDYVQLLRLLRDQRFNGAIGLQCYAVSGDSRDNLQRSIRAWKKHLKQLHGDPR